MDDFLKNNRQCCTLVSGYIGTYLHTSHVHLHTHTEGGEHTIHLVSKYEEIHMKHIGEAEFIPHTAQPRASGLLRALGDLQLP